MIYALNYNNSNIGNVRETFFVNQLKYENMVEISDKTDFLINEKYSFEVGGKRKTGKQIKDIENSYIAADNIEYGFANKIPLWLFGFLY